jgi:hypothetical protein
MGNYNSVIRRLWENRPGLRKLPRLYWVLMAGFALLAAAGAVRMVNSIANWYWLTFAGVNPGPLYLVITGVLWVAAGLAGLTWLGFGLRYDRLVATGAAFFIALTYWIDRILVANIESRAGNTLFAALMTLLFLSFVLFLLRPWQEAIGTRGKKNGEK